MRKNLLTSFVDSGYLVQQDAIDYILELPETNLKINNILKALGPDQFIITLDDVKKILNETKKYKREEKNHHFGSTIHCCERL